MIIEIPKNKQLIKIDTIVNPHVPIFKDIPLSEIEILKQQVLEM